MKKLILLALTFCSLSTFASVRITTIDTNDTMTDSEIQYACSQDLKAAAIKVSEIASRLSPENLGALSVSAYYGQDPINSPTTQPGYPYPNPNDPRMMYESYCVLVFDSKNPSVQWNESSLIRFTHLSSANWNTACADTYQTASSNPNSPVTMDWRSWSLIQGRMCEVTTVEARRTP